jgi:adenylate kinase
VRIIITGTPGTGKTKIAKELAGRSDLELIDLKAFVNANRLFTIEEGQKSVDMERLKDKLLGHLKGKEDYIIEGHLACEIEIPADFIFVLRTHPKKLRNRLEKRRYGRKKLDENLEAEMLDYCSQRIEFVYDIRPLELDTTKRDISQCVDEMLKAMEQKKTRLDHVDFSHELKVFLHLKR